VRGFGFPIDITFLPLGTANEISPRRLTALRIDADVFEATNLAERNHSCLPIVPPRVIPLKNKATQQRLGFNE
jgi:hypothetical protein